uniref:Sodium/hydrogen exchanger 8 n=1 Tax=Pseudo-nitzschia australis TaxID=44445 RepID=A0A7S4EK88_9STRA|mmetsp:Transcript_771/g.1705  ORF Transcript_771/g.1705 Transcript_771/m.1705 type:complete len:800 (+) Transcript_771:241-2640(+)|eukprot:CAMPEP_0168165956 /NCGR_PEP_ID=MMETSP0139_2-20121125/1755_1 /TAXON_ID=44445 /ORGANISM="Pseudo-nitzschia australis, Strain 10249 10 AB" /LENGTH=799 /DNA_ID=CAMNT_0008083091 /DNA_START=240 /DNA_END=2639 /DNA_ORIENTATION=-
MTNNDNDAFSNTADGGLDDSYSDERTPQIFFLCFSAMLGIVLFLSRFLEDSPRLRTYLSEPAMTLLVGVFCSLIVRLLNESDYEEYQNHYQSEHDGADKYYTDDYDDQYHNNGEDFDESEYASKYLRALPNFFLLFPSKIFFLVLLPPILFNSGYQLQRELFYRHFSAIALFSTVGTALSAFGAGGFLWFLSTRGLLGNAFEPTPLELLTFGALIAATDTVSVVGVLQRKRVDPHLFSLVFGESALNDAVALVLFKTLSDFLRQNAMNSNDVGDNNADIYKNIGKYLLDLLVQCVVSPILGLIFTSLMGLAFKHGKMRGHMILELSLYVLPVYMPFMLAELLELSGMITIFFSGIFARRYMEPNVSEETREHALILFRLLAFLAELCIFLELGLSVSGMHKGHFSLPFVSWAFVAALLGRAVGVYPLSALYNLSLTRSVISAARARTIAVEIMAKGKCTTCTEIESCEENARSNMDESKCKSKEENIILDVETPKDNNNPSINYIHMDEDTKGEIKIRNHDDIMTATAPTSPGRESETSTAGELTSSSNISPADLNARTKSYCKLMPAVVSKRETPQRKRDKIIPVKFMHLLWFAGLRGAVAYACAREFPDVYGHRDDFIAATMVIVVITIVLMGGATEPLMDRLGIRMNVDNDEYMQAWHQQRKLKGRLLHFEYHWIYRFVVKDQSVRRMDESYGYIEQDDDGIAKDDMILGFVPGRDLGAAITETRRKEALKMHSMRRLSHIRGYRCRKSSQYDDLNFDRSLLIDECVRSTSIMGETYKEGDAGNIDSGCYTSPGNY